MDSKEMLHFGLTYSFPFKFFELLRFGISQLVDNNASFQEIFNKIHQRKFFSVSRLYLQSTSNKNLDQFADYLTSEITASDYLPSGFSSLLNDYAFIKEDYTILKTSPYWKSISHVDPEEMHLIIQAALKLHMAEDEEVYRLSIPIDKQEKYGLARIWEDFQHYICIDRKRGLLQFITSGLD